MTDRPSPVGRRACLSEPVGNLGPAIPRLATRLNGSTRTRSCTPRWHVMETFDVNIGASKTSDAGGAEVRRFCLLLPLPPEYDSDAQRRWQSTSLGFSAAGGSSRIGARAASAG